MEKSRVPRKPGRRMRKAHQPIIPRVIKCNERKCRRCRRVRKLKFFSFWQGALCHTCDVCRGLAAEPTPYTNAERKRRAALAGKLGADKAKAVARKIERNLQRQIKLYGEDRRKNPR